MVEEMENWQTGDISAFEALFLQYQRLVFKNAYLITGRKEEAEDVLQQVFISVWKSRHTFDPNKGKLTTWLHRITVNECMKKHRKTEPVAELFQNMRLMDTSEEPGEALMKQEQYERMMKAVNLLDTKHRSILVLRYFNELSYEDIAKAAGIPLGTVKSRINNGLKQLREKMGGQIVASGECE
jgi:RNA polymerase sigma-70 factor (ECF subfamily)